MQKFHIDMGNVLSRFARGSTEQAHAERLLSAIDDERDGAPYPVPVWIAAILPQLQGVSAIMISHPDLLYVPRRDLTGGIPYSWLFGRPDTQVALFEDGSFLIFEVSGHLHGIALHLRDDIARPIDLTGGFPESDWIARVSATQDICALHPDADAWAASLKHGTYTLMAAIYAAIEDCYDPKIKPGSLENTVTYDPEDLAELKDLTQTFWEALGVPHPATVEIFTVTDENPVSSAKMHTPSIRIARKSDRAAMIGAADALQTLLETCIDLDRFNGFEWVCVDTDHEDRTSAYERRPTQVLRIVDAEDKRTSEHALFEVRNKALRLLAKSGVSPADANVMIRLSPDDLSGPPSRDLDDEIPF